MSAPARRLDLPPAAAAFLLAVAVSAAVAATLAAAQLGLDEPWVRAAILAAAAAAAQSWIVPTGRNHGFHTAIVFVVAAAMMLPVGLVAVVGLVQHVPEGLRKRYRWYIQVFNAASATLCALLAAGAAHLVGLHGAQARWALAGAAAAAAYVAANHLLLGVMLRLARGHSLRESGLFSVDALGMDAVLAGLGVVTALVWEHNIWLLPAAIAPLLLSQRTFMLLSMLRESEQRFRAMFESASVGVALLDLDGNFVSVNPALTQMLGRSDLVGTAYPLDDDERPLFGELVAAARAEYRLERQFETADGRAGHAHVAAALVRDADERPRWVIAMAQDMTERRRLEEQLRQSQKMEAVGLLAGGIAHDFNNILTAITGCNEFALYRVDAGLPVPREDLLEIRHSTERAASLTRQLLAFGRKQVVQPRTLDLRAVVRDVDMLLRRLLGDHIELVHDLPDEPTLVRADATQLEQVLLNLAVNARDAMQEGGRLTVAVRNDGDGVVLTVADTGCGMDGETRARIFEPFYTTKPLGEGTGLGLSTVYGIVNSSGGSIGVESEPGAGATFRIELPRIVDEEVAEQIAAAALRPVTGSETVLLIDDEPVVRTIAREALKSQGYTVLEAATGEEALRLVERRSVPADIVVTDVAMPGLSGFDVVERLRLHWPATPVVFVSGYAERDRAGAPADAQFLLKPFTPAQLARRVRETLDGLPAEVVAA